MEFHSLRAVPASPKLTGVPFQSVPLEFRSTKKAFRSIPFTACVDAATQDCHQREFGRFGRTTLVARRSRCLPQIADKMGKSLEDELEVELSPTIGPLVVPCTF